MPLFNNYELWTLPETGDVSREKLKEAFPEFYDPQNPKGVKLLASPARFKTLKKVREDEKSIQVGNVRTAPPATGHKAVTNIIVDGKTVNLQYSTVMPQVGSHNKSFTLGTNRLTLHDGFVVQPGQEDLLAFMHFGLRFISNGANPSQRDPFYEWDRPIIKASARIADWKKNQEVEALIYTKLTKDQVLKALKGLGLTPKTTDEQNRTFLRDRVRAGNDVFVATFYELIGEEQKQDKEETGKEETASELVDRLMSEGQMKFEKGKFYTMSKVKIGEWNSTPIWDSKTESADDARFALIDHLKTNDVLFAKLSK